MLFHSVRVHSNCFLSESVISPFCIIHRGCRLTKVILDRGVELPRNLIVGENAELDAKRFRRSEGGVTLITKSMLERLKKTEPQLFEGFEDYRAAFIPSH